MTRLARPGRRLAAAGAVLCLAAAVPVAQGAGMPHAGAARVSRADASSGAHITLRLPAGLSASEHGALERAGAMGPVRYAC